MKRIALTLLAAIALVLLFAERVPVPPECADKTVCVFHIPAR